MEIVTTICFAIWLYGTWFALILGAGSAFMSVIFFFWTRTGERKDNIDLQTKYLYINPLYFVIRISTIVLLLSKTLEIFYLTTFAKNLGQDVSALDLFSSHLGLPVYLLIIALTYVAIGTYYNKTCLSFTIPLALTSWFFLVVCFVKNVQYTIDAYFVMVLPSFWNQMIVYLVALSCVVIVFNWARFVVEKK